MKLVRSATLAALAIVGMLSSGCSRSHIEAINLANEGDQSVKVNVENAVQKYEQAIQLDPTNHRILWKLAAAYEKKEDWDKMASTLARATQVAPDFATYWYKRGLALINQAEGGNKDAFEQAKEPLKKCIEKDPNLAECYYLMGEALEWTDDEQGAVDYYTKRFSRTRKVFYPALAQLYRASSCTRVGAGLPRRQVVQPSEKNREDLQHAI